MPRSTADLRTTRRIRGTLAITCAGLLALAALGLNGTAASAAKPKPTVAVAKLKGVGKLLVDARGRTLYTLTNAGQAVPCAADCAAAWPPLTISKGSPKGAKGVTGLGVDSTGKHVTARGLPLYRFSGDRKAGRATGEGINSFGGVWHVVSTTASPATNGTNPPTPGSNYAY